MLYAFCFTFFSAGFVYSIINLLMDLKNTKMALFWRSAVLEGPRISQFSVRVRKEQFLI